MLLSILAVSFQLGFDGVLATDCGALRDATINHHRYATNRDTATAAVKAGVDSNCGSVFPTALPDAIGNKTLTEAELDVSVRRLLRARMRLGLFDEGDEAAGVPKYDIDSVNSKKHQRLALELARQGVVLLQNNEINEALRHGEAGSGGSGGSGVRVAAEGRMQGAAKFAKLPLSKDAYRTVAMVGPNANASMNLLSGYHGDAPFLVSPLEAMSAKWGSENVHYSVGCNMSDKDPAQVNVTHHSPHHPLTTHHSPHHSPHTTHHTTHHTPLTTPLTHHLPHHHPPYHTHPPTTNNPALNSPTGSRGLTSPSLRLWPSPTPRMSLCSASASAATTTPAARPTKTRPAS
jgi:hypothetical protein